jgi:hypothetical protein
MKLLHFSVEHNHGLLCGSERLDLHNDYDFDGFDYDANSNSAVFAWSRAKEASRTAVYQTILLRFSHLSILRIEMPAEPNSPDDSHTLAFIGFLHPDDLHVMNGCLTQAESNETYHMIFRFLSNASFKCYSDTVTCELS